MNLKDFKWTLIPESYEIYDDIIEIITKPHTDLWQRTYYHFQNDNAPVLQIESDETSFSFIVKTEFKDSHHRFDQCGVVMNHGYSDWATTSIDASVKSMWYRLSRRDDDYCIECSSDGVIFSQMRICHMFKGDGTVSFGIYACSPENSSFEAVFTDIQMTECQWMGHQGQAAD